MCGIAGSIGKRRIDGEAIRRALDSMANRGPDALRHKSIEVGSNFVNLLHGRLSILDLDERSHQPFSIGPCTMVFNGEIYNFVELKSQLEKQGESFSTTSDTEVLLKYYLRYGDACVEHFEGMWAFAIYDERTGNLLLSRDRFAEKPLYFFEDSDTFYFASEIKTLQRLTRCQFEVIEDVADFPVMYQVWSVSYGNRLSQRRPPSFNKVLAIHSSMLNGSPNILFRA